MIEELEINTTKKYQFVNITDSINELIEKNSIKEGIAIVFTAHTTASILVTENEEGLLRDWIDFFKKTTSNFDFQHNKIDNNADSHIIGGLTGNEKSFIIKDGNLLLGRWQTIFLLELDGPRRRKVFVKIIKC